MAMRNTMFNKSFRYRIGHMIDESSMMNNNMAAENFIRLSFFYKYLPFREVVLGLTLSKKT